MKAYTQVYHVTSELDLLEANIIEAQHYAERIIVKEAAHYWSGVPKPLFVTEAWNRFKKYKSVEIMVVPDDVYILDIPKKHTTPEEYLYGRTSLRENRNRTRTYGWDNVRDDVDYVIEADVDEIIDHKRFFHLDNVLRREDFLHVSIRYENRLRYMNRKLKRHDEYRVFNAHEPVMELNVKHRKRITIGQYIGWHFSSCFSSAEGLREKALSNCQEYGFQGVDNVQPLEEFQRMYDDRINMTTGNTPDKPLGGFSDLDVDLDDYPEFVAKHPELFPWDLVDIPSRK